MSIFGLILIGSFVVASLIVLAWLLYEIHIDKVAEQDSDMWRDLTREPSDRWPPKGDL